MSQNVRLAHPGLRPRWGVPVPPSSADGPLHPSFTYGSCIVPTLAVVGSLACHVRECVVFPSTAGLGF